MIGFAQSNMDTQLFFAPLLAEGGLLDSSSFSKTLAIVLWVGLAILSISLVLLMRTRWGQAKPLSKCAVLSLLAHFLLFGYAYGTKLFFDYGDPQAEEAYQLTLYAAAEDSELDDSSSDQATDEKQPWEELTPEFEGLLAVQPQNVAPARLASLEKTSLVRPRVIRPEMKNQAPSDILPETAPVRPGAPTKENGVGMIRSEGVKATMIETPNVRRQAKADPLGPAGASLRRREAISSDPAPRKKTEGTELPTEFFNEGSRLQKLADATLKSQPADAVASSRDSLNKASNKGDSSRDSSGANASGEQNSQNPTGNRQDGGVASNRKSAPKIESRPALLNPSVYAELAKTGISGDGRQTGGQVIPKVYRSRVGENRLKSAQRFGGNQQTEAAVEAALKWLAANQETDGRWNASRHGAGNENQVAGHDRQGAGANADSGITGLVLLAFLGAGNTHLEGDYRKNVQQALEYLLELQKDDGNMAGSASLFAVMYCHGMATLALSEAYAITGDQRLRPYVERAIQYTIDAQHPSGGGWRYQPGDEGDMSQFGWQVMALRSAELGGIEIPASTRAGMLRFLHGVGSGRSGGLASYRKGERTSSTMTAEALCCRYFINTQRNQEAVDEAANYILQELPKPGKANLYYWYYATLAMFQTQGEPWRQWNAALQDQLLARQRTDAAMAGSWNPDTVWGGHGGRAYTTAMSALCLEVYYRYLPLYGNKKP